MATENASLTIDTADLIDPDRYAAHGYPNEEFKLFRREAPIYYYDRPGVTPFWSFTKQKEMHFISKHPRQFISSDRLVIGPDREGGDGERQSFPPSIITMDPPDHRIHRNVISHRFTPRALLELEPRVEEVADEIIDDVIAKYADPATGIGTCDFVLEMSAKLPLYIILEMIGSPREDSQQLFEWQNQIIGSSDPEYQTAGNAQETAQRAGAEQREYFSTMVQRRRQAPQDDVIDLLIGGDVGGRTLEDAEILSEMGLLMAGGIETTRNATSGGMLALMERPEQYRDLKEHPELVKSAVEEVLRWTSPIIHFGRMTTEDTVVGDQMVRAGETVCMWYASGNRDEDVFENPDEFNIRRYPNEHVAFGGFGEHFCLGANLARTELWVMFRKVMERFEWIEQDGDVSRLRSGFVGGIKHLPVRFKVA